ncbi:hypothetical protein [Modestobacter sp. SYSU DS0290]
MRKTLTRFLESTVVQRWFPLLLAVGAAAAAVVHVVEGDLLRAALLLLLALYWSWSFRRSFAVPAPVPHHVDEAWARRVIAEAGAPEGVGAILALRRAEPALSLVHAEQLADRVAG